MLQNPSIIKGKPLRQPPYMDYRRFLQGNLDPTYFKNIFQALIK